MFFSWGAALIDAWLAVVGGLTGVAGKASRAWKALPGDLLGLIVMRGSGIAAPNRTVDAGDVTALVVEDPRVGRYLDLGLIPIHAQTLGRYVFCRGPLDDRTLAHECEHIRQWQRWGPLYLALYFGSSGFAFLSGRHAYRDNRFETAARARADRDF